MDDFEWTVVHEGQLLDAMVGHKPVGVNKYFQMAFICDKFTDNMHKDIDPGKIWSHLETMYNLEALDDSESIPFPNSEREFNLPDAEFGPFMIKKDEEKDKNASAAVKGGRETPKGGRETPKGGRETPKGGRETPKGDRDTPKLAKEVVKKEEKPSPIKNQKDQKESKEAKDNNKTPTVTKKEIKKEPEKAKAVVKSRNNSTTPKDDAKVVKPKSEDTPKPAKRPTRGSLKPNDDSGSSGKSSPITVTPSSAKRRRI